MFGRLKHYKKYEDLNCDFETVGGKTTTQKGEFPNKANALAKFSEITPTRVGSYQSADILHKITSSVQNAKLSVVLAVMQSLGGLGCHQDGLYNVSTKMLANLSSRKHYF